jgi:hypothetical protein
MEITSHRVVRASYSAAYVLPLTINEAFSLANGPAIGRGAGAGAAISVSPATLVSTIPDPAALRKSLLE